MILQGFAIIRNCDIHVRCNTRESEHWCLDIVHICLHVRQVFMVILVLWILQRLPPPVGCHGLRSPPPPPAGMLVSHPQPHNAGKILIHDSRLQISLKMYEGDLWHGKDDRCGIKASRPTWGTTSLQNCASYPIRSNPRDIISERLLNYLAVRCFPLNITNRYVILREWVHQYNGRGRCPNNGSPLLGHRQAVVGTPAKWPASMHGSKAVGVACLELGVSVRWVGDWQLIHLNPTGACAPVARWLIWLATLFKRGGRDGIIMDSYRASTSRVRGALWKALYVQDVEKA
jgi:hypothetical protein